VPKRRGKKERNFPKNSSQNKKEERKDLYRGEKEERLGMAHQYLERKEAVGPIKGPNAMLYREWDALG